MFARLARAVAAVPGVTATGLAAPTLRPWDSGRGRVMFSELQAAGSDAGLPSGVHMTDEGLLPALGIRVLAGRNFHPSETSNVAIISRSLAERMGGATVALERTITLLAEDDADPAEAFRIIGVANDVAYDGLAEQGTRRVIRYQEGSDRRRRPLGRLRAAYVPLARVAVSTVSIAAATSVDPASIISAVRGSIAQVAPGSAVHWTGTMADEVALEYAPSRFYGVLVSAFSASALLLTSVGLFALLWNTAAARTGEMGLRLALGARRGGIAWLLVSAGARPVALGIGLGLLGALWCADWMAAFLYDLPALDPVSFGGATALLLLVCLGASLIPARRAASVDPLVALKRE
ncbi:MAG: ABC transporter permease [Acidobacteria bacterium]|nr:ABC transporter permease [Acidobacteriota bacterium]